MWPSAMDGCCTVLLAGVVLAKIEIVELNETDGWIVVECDGWTDAGVFSHEAENSLPIA